MRFQSIWKPVVDSGDNNVKLKIEDGSHSPPYDELSENTQTMIDELVSSAESILDELTADIGKGDPEREYAVNTSGYVNDGDIGHSFTTVSLNVERVR